MLRIEHLTKTYGDKKAVDDLSLHICAGEIYGFIGHNGAGKTTTIKSCCGILQFEEGQIYVDGVSIREDPIGCKRKIAYLPDNPDLYEFLSGVQYLNFIADVYGVPKEEREQRIKEYADLFGLTEDLAQPISAYSHGMKQKLAIISALIHSASCSSWMNRLSAWIPRRPMSLSRSCGGCAIAVRPFSSPPMCWR